MSKFKSLYENFKKYVVLDVRNYPANGGYDYAIILKEEIEVSPLCELYDDYGHKIGCEYAQCYSRQNDWGCDIWEDFKNAFVEKFGMKAWEKAEGDDLAELFSSYHESDFKDFLNYFTEEQREWIKGWLKENEHHTEAIAFTHSDGANYRSIIIDIEFPTDKHLLCPKVDKKIAVKVLKEMPESTFIEKGTEKKVETKNYIFLTTRWARDWAIWWVEEI